MQFCKNAFMKQLHYLSGILISVFTGIHLFNHVCSIAGADKHIEIMQVLRLFYRNALAETILLAAVPVQIISGISLCRKKWRTTGGWEKLRIWTGLYMGIFLLVHVTSVLIGRAVLHLDTNFYFGVAGLNTFPFSLFFIPYYGLAVLSFFGHIAAVHYRKMKYSLSGLSPENQSKAILFFGILFTVVIFYGLTNHFRGVTIPQKYDVLIGK